MSKPCRNNSMYVMIVFFPDKENKKPFYAFSFQNEEVHGPDFVFQKMKRRLLEGYYKNNYTTARFVEVKTNRVLHEMYAGTQKF